MIASPTDMTYFVEIARAENISRAAERLGISQPSLSLSIQRLEHTLGTALFMRSKRGVTLTQAGKQFYSHAAHLLELWDRVQAETLASVEKVQGTYTIGCHVSVALHVLSGFLPQMLKDYPKLNVQLEHDTSRHITEDVISLKTDIGLVVNPVQHPDLIIHPLYKGEVTFWRCENHSQHATQDISSGQAVLFTDPSLIRTQDLIRQYEAQGIGFARVVSSSSLEVIADLVANGAGVGILPVHVAQGLGKTGTKKLVRVPKAPVFYDDHCILYRVENKSVRAVQALSQAIRAFCKQRQDKTR